MPKKPEVKRPKKSLFKIDFDIGRVNLTQRALFAKNLSVMLKAGLVITEALSIAIDSTQGRLKRTLKAILKSVESGQSLSSSFANYPKVFPAFFVSATYAGESSGNLDKNLENLAFQLEKDKELMAKVKGAMIYPIVVLSAAFCLGLAMAFFVLPKITPLFEGMKMELPFTTRVLIWLSHFIQDYGTALFFSLIFLVVFMIWLFRQSFIKPITHWLFLNLPIIKKVSVNTNLARFSRTLGMLLESGLNIDEALKITQDTVDNYHYKKALTIISQRIGKGSKLSDNLKNFEKFFPNMVIKMVRVGEESGELENILKYLADFYDIEVDTATKSLATAIEPILLMGMGLVVGFLALSIITPIYNITGGINK